MNSRVSPPRSRWPWPHPSASRLLRPSSYPLAAQGFESGLANAPVLPGDTPETRVHDVIANGHDACERAGFPQGEVLRGHVPPCPTTNAIGAASSLIGNPQSSPPPFRPWHGFGVCASAGPGLQERDDLDGRAELRADGHGLRPTRVSSRLSPSSRLQCVATVEREAVHPQCHAWPPEGGAGRLEGERVSRGSRTTTAAREPTPRNPNRRSGNFPGAPGVSARSSGHRSVMPHLGLEPRQAASGVPHNLSRCGSGRGRVVPPAMRPSGRSPPDSSPETLVQDVGDRRVDVADDHEAQGHIELVREEVDDEEVQADDGGAIGGSP